MLLQRKQSGRRNVPELQIAPGVRERPQCHLERVRYAPIAEHFSGSDSRSCRRTTGLLRAAALRSADMVAGRQMRCFAGACVVLLLMMRPGAAQQKPDYQIVAPEMVLQGEEFSARV